MYIFVIMKWEFQIRKFQCLMLDFSQNILMNFQLKQFSDHLLTMYVNVQNSSKIGSDIYEHVQIEKS